MHLRSAVGITRTQRDNEFGQKQGTKTAAAAGGTTTCYYDHQCGYTAIIGRGPTRRKCIIWALVLLQICFVGLLWLLQVDTNVMMKHNEIHRQQRSGKKTHSDVRGGGRIDFITKKTQTSRNTEKTVKLEVGILVEEEPAYLKKDFILHKMRLNVNESEDGGEMMGVAAEGDVEINSENNSRWCFREGTLNQTQTTKTNTQQDLALVDVESALCQCQAEWHGRDCGQPEIIWRTLLAVQHRSSPSLLQLREPPTAQAPHRLIYMLDGYFFNLDLLELQLRTVLDVVDYFVINISQKTAKPLHIKAIERRLKDIVKNGQFLVNHCRRPTLNGAWNSTLPGSCSPMQAYSLLKQAIAQGRLKPTRASDLFLYTSDSEILNRKALKFLKYYLDTDLAHGPPMMAMRFRLKHVIYGFYWQHPKLTLISGILSSLATLESASGGNGDPRLLQHRVAETSQIPTILIGDLNHFGGWYCQHCQQPQEIIAQLHANQDATGGEQNVKFPNVTRNRQIDANYIQKLIAQGQSVDESSPTLLKLRRYTDKYYAPEYAEQCSWKFGNLLVNLYVTLEEDGDDDGDADDGAY